MKKTALWLALLITTVGITTSAIRYFTKADEKLAEIVVDVERPIGPLPRPWLALAQGGENLKTFMNENATQVAALKPQYIRIDHIYDQFGVVSRDGTGLKFDWTELDKVVKQITGVGAKPFLSLSYTPEVMAVTDIISEPKDWNEWSLVVQKTIEHYSGEMGLNNVYYEVWNEPDLFGGWKMGGNKDYRTMYRYAAIGANRATGVRAFKIGGPATTALYKNWMDGFFPYILANKLRLDFFSWHTYSLDIDKYVKDAADVDVWLEAHPEFSQVEKIVTEMGPNSERGLQNDTVVGAAHLVAVSREMMAKIKYGFSFAVSGSWGIVGKPRYTAMQKLNQLGDNRLGVTGEGSFVRAIGAIKDKTYQVLLTNYDPRGQHSEVVPVSFVNIAPGAYTWRTVGLGGETDKVDMATEEAVLQRNVPMAPNSVIMVELISKT